MISFLGCFSSNHPGRCQVLHPDIVGLPEYVRDPVLVAVGELGPDDVSAALELEVVLGGQVQTGEPLLRVPRVLPGYLEKKLF